MRKRESDTRAAVAVQNGTCMCVLACTLAQSISVFVLKKKRARELMCVCVCVSKAYRIACTTAALSVKSSDSCAVATEILYSVSIPV